MNRLFVTDLDGTLLKSDITLSRNSVSILNEQIARGVPITYATSRSFYTAQKLLADVHFCLPCITFNGVYVINAATGQVLRKNLLDNSFFDAVCSLGRSLGLQPFVFGKTENSEKLLYTLPGNDAQAHFVQERKNRGDQRLCESADYALLDEIITVTFLYPQEQLLPLKDRIAEQYEGTISMKLIRDIYNPGYYSLEIANKHANKGDMLLYLSRLLNVSTESVTVFGDQANDEEMFRVAGTRIAVRNAAEELKAMADKIIASNEEDGVAQYLQQL